MSRVGARGTQHGPPSYNAAVPSRKGNSESPFWREALAPYAYPNVGRSVLDLATSVVPFLLLSVTAAIVEAGSMPGPAVDLARLSAGARRTWQAPA